MKRQPKCKTCGELIAFVLRPGFVVKGRSRYFVVNADDRRPHRPRCDLIVALKEAKSSGPAQLRRLSQKQQGSLTAKRGAAPATTEGVQLDAFLPT